MSDAPLIIGEKIVDYSCKDPKIAELPWPYLTSAINLLMIQQILD